MVSCLCCVAYARRMIPDRLMVGQLTLDQPVVVRIHVREPLTSIHASCIYRRRFRMQTSDISEYQDYPTATVFQR